MNNTERLELLRKLGAIIEQGHADGIPSPEDIVTKALAAKVQWEQYKADNHL